MLTLRMSFEGVRETQERHVPTGRATQNRQKLLAFLM